MPTPEKRKLERVQYWQGQTLRAQDLRNLQGVEAQRRWWHNRSIHNAYGIAEGLTATWTNSNVEVSTGMAYDIFGRELILECPQTVPLPANVPSGWPPMTLLVRYLGPGHDLPPDEITEVCWTQKGSVRPGTLTFTWKPASCVTPSDGVAIFQLMYLGGGSGRTGGEATVIPAPDPSFGAISAEPLSRPRLASGATVPGQTSWDLWTVGYSANETAYLAGVQTWIDTSAAGFTDTPCYFAWLQGSLWSSQLQLFLPIVVTNIANVSLIGFTFQLCLPGMGPPPGGGEFEIARTEIESTLASDSVTPNNFNQFAQQQGLYVSWIGCQMPGKACACSQPTTSSSVAVQSSMSSQNMLSRNASSKKLSSKTRSKIRSSKKS